MPLLVFFLIVGVVIVAGVVSYYAEKEREKKLAAFAAQNGWSFDSGRSGGTEDLYPFCELFRRGSSRYRSNVMAGKSGENAMAMFDYRYSTGSGKNRQTHRCAVLHLRPPFFLQRLTIREEGFLDKVVSAFGWNDIDFESGEFSSRFHVSAEDRKWAYDALPAMTMEFLLSRPAFSMECAWEGVIIYAREKLSPPCAQTLLETATGFLDGIPAFARERNPVH